MAETLYQIACLQGTCHIGEAWQMLHSIAGQVEYTKLLGQSIAQLVRYALSLPERLNEQTTAGQKTELQSTGIVVGVWILFNILISSYL